MGSYIEINDTLQLTTEQGFPKELVLADHIKTPYTASNFEDKVFSFFDKPSARIYQLPPVRIFLVHNINGKWLFWGHCLVIEQTIHSSLDGYSTTSGKFIITEIYDPEFQKLMTKRETPEGTSFFT